ncbi:MAG: hypothetical protein DI598_16235 [Pseudopedobacter saltans]|uniref:Uncharacterized protein n=1 Tax=Pseudopedobacter saltans TaxID=151895 RepID=A0A2W5EN89_9SPHI|nr:MAG: hypothetical protein DI598_16235 [Pseudopedobacter saltans]
MLLLWFILIIWAVISSVHHIFSKTTQSDDFFNGILFSLGAAISLIAFSFIVLKKERFYTHMIVNEEGLIYFDKYRFRQSKIIRWQQIVSSPIKNNKNERDIYLRHIFSGSKQIIFWYTQNSKLFLLKENFGGYGPFPFLYANKNTLRNAFIKGVLTYRKDLRIDPKLLRFVVA